MNKIQLIDAETLYYKPLAHPRMLIDGILALILFADIGFDVLQLFIEALGFEAFTCRLVCFGVPKGRTNGEFTAELRYRAVDRNTTHNGNLTRFLGLPFHVEKDFESAALHNNLNFEDLLNV